MWAKNGGLPVSPPVRMGPICDPLTPHMAARGGRPRRVLWGRGFTPLPSRTSAWSREDFTTKVWARRACSFLSPAALRRKKAAFGVGLGLLPFRTQDSNRPRHSIPPATLASRARRSWRNEMLQIAKNNFP